MLTMLQMSARLSQIEIYSYRIYWSRTTGRFKVSLRQKSLEWDLTFIQMFGADGLKCISI